jgi:hypothetical protein
MEETIIAKVSEGVPLAQVCRELGLGLTTWYDWCRADAELSDRIARAREAGFDVIAAEALRLADTPHLGQIVRESDKDGTVVTTEDMLGHRKLQIETRLKLLAKWDPKRYGDRVQVAGDAESPLTVQVVRLTDER